MNNKKVNITLFPVPKKYGMMESPQIDIAQLCGDLKSKTNFEVCMCDYRFLYFTKEIGFQSLFQQCGDLLSQIQNEHLILQKYSAAFYDYFFPLQENDIFVFPISVLEQFRIEYLVPVLLFSYFLKKKHPEKQVILFGNYPTAHARVLMKSFPFLDGIILNGDNLGLINFLTCRKLENVIYRDFQKNIHEGEFVKKVAVEDFSTPDFSGFDLSFYSRRGKLVLPYELSRGCKNSCFFCYYIHKGGKIYKKSISKVLSDLSALKKKYNTSLFHFHDAEINFDIVYLKDICDAMISQKVSLYWSALAIPSGLDNTLLKKLFQAGCRQLRFGIESGSQRILDIIGKGTSTHETIEILRSCKEIGIATYATFIVDLVQETQEDLKQTLLFIKDNRVYLDDIQICSYGELGNFPITYLNNPSDIPTEIKSKKKRLFEQFQYDLNIPKRDIVEFIRNFG